MSNRSKMDKLHPVKKPFPLSDEAPVAYCTACVTSARTCGKGAFGWEKKVSSYKANN